MDTNIGDKIKALREQSGLKQANIAKFLNVDQSFISKIESNERPLTSDLLDKLCSLFGVTVSSLYEKSVPSKQMRFALRAKEISQEDLETLSVINRIALNVKYMNSLSEGNDYGR